MTSFIVKNLYDLIEGSKAKPVDMLIMIETSRIGKLLIKQWLDERLFYHVLEEKNTQSLWKKLESVYEHKTAENKAFLIKKLVNLKFREDSSIARHLNDFKSIVN